MDLNLRGRRALITGSSKGIGLAIARSLASEGCHVQLVARTQSELDKVTAKIRADYGVEAPNLGFVSVEPQGSVEFSLEIARG